MTVSTMNGSVSSTSSTRWIQLVLGLVAMMSISSPQYVWTLFTKSFQDNLHTTLPAIQITFSILNVAFHLHHFVARLPCYFLIAFILQVKQSNTNILLLR